MMGEGGVTGKQARSSPSTGPNLGLGGRRSCPGPPPPGEQPGARLALGQHFQAFPSQGVEHLGATLRPCSFLTSRHKGGPLRCHSQPQTRHINSSRGNEPAGGAPLQSTELWGLGPTWSQAQGLRAAERELTGWQPNKFSSSRRGGSARKVVGRASQ